MEKENFLQTKLKKDEPVLGIWSLINSPVVTEILGVAGLDFVLLDMEHGLFDLPSLDASIRAAESTRCSPIVRVPTVGHPAVQNVLDMGAHGLIFPQVKDADAAVEAVKSTKFPPMGTRGYNPFTRYSDYRARSDGKSSSLANDFSLTSIILENEKTMSQLDQILDIPGLDIIYLGVYDLSLALGCSGNVDAPEIRKFLETAIPKIRKSGKAAGVLVKNQEEMRRFVNLGANFLVYIVDTFVFQNAVAEGPRMLKSLKA